MQENGTNGAPDKAVGSDIFQKSKQIAETIAQNPDRALDVLAIIANRLEYMKRDRGRVGQLYRNSLVIGTLLKAYFRGDYRVLSWHKVVMALASLLYLIYIVDVIPDFIPIIGLLDDAGVIAWVVSLLQKEIKNAKFLFSNN